MISKDVLGYRKGKTVRVYVWIWSYDYPFLLKRFLNFKIMIGWFTLITVRVYLTLVHQTDPVFCKCSG